MRFANPWGFWFLLIIPVFILVLVYAAKTKRKAMKTFIHPDQHGILVNEFSRAKRRVKMFLLFCVLLSMIMALLRPQWGYEWIDVKKKGIDIVIALDVSKSMLARDIKPSRLERTKKEIQNLINALKGDRIALVAFSGSAFVTCPLTLDHAAAKMFLADMSPDTIPLGGTNLAMAVEKSLTVFDEGDEERRMLILISDGEHHEGDIDRALEKAKAKNVTIHTVAVGTSEGAPIPVGNEGGTEYVKDSSGQPVITRPDSALLSRVAGSTGGRMVVLGYEGFPLEDIYSYERDTIAKKEFKTDRDRRYRERFAIPLFLALIFFIAEAALSERKVRRASGIKEKGSLKIIFLLGLGANVFFTGFSFGADSVKEGNRLYERGQYDDALAKYNEAQAKAEDAPELYYNMGNALYKTNRFDGALGSYQSGSTDGSNDWSAQRIYNVGNTYFRMGRLEDALKSFEEAYKLNPDDEDTKYNIEFTKKKMEEMRQEAKNTEKKAREKNQSSDQGEKSQEKPGEGKSENAQGAGNASTGGDKPSGEEQSQNKSGQKEGQNTKNDQGQGDREARASQGENKQGRKGEGNAHDNARAGNVSGDLDRLLDTIADEEMKSLPMAGSADQPGKDKPVLKDW